VPWYDETSFRAEPFPGLALAITLFKLSILSAEKSKSVFLERDVLERDRVRLHVRIIVLDMS